MSTSFDWSGSSGDSWARLWPATDRALAEVGRALDAAILQAAPPDPFRALDVGCGPGTTALALASARSDAGIIAADLSPALVEVARARTDRIPNVEVRLGDAVQLADACGPFDLVVSRHGVMFFDQPQRALAALRNACRPDAALLFSCFRGWEDNPWASELSAAVTGRPAPPPGREPSGFAFADPDYVAELLTGAGWSTLDRRSLDFTYVAGEGGKAVDEAFAFLSQIGPASSRLRALPDGERPAALDRLRAAIGRHERGARIEFPAAAWIWSARA